MPYVQQCQEGETMKAVCLLSGGLDSTTLLAKAKKECKAITALSVDYGQRHCLELEAAEAVVEHFDVPHIVVDLSTLNFQSSSQTNPKIQVPHGHYADESMKKTVVPNRNMILLSIAAGIAIDNDFDTVAYAAHAGDHPIYNDCRPEFVEALRHPLKQLGVGIWTPFICMSKCEIVTIGVALGVDYAMTYSCYEGDTVHCGLCGTCVERREAFGLADVVDPTTYREDF